MQSDPPRALIFDVDGTLAETEALHLAAFNAAFAAAGLGWHWDRAAYRRLLETTGGKERIARHMAEIGAAPDAGLVARLHADKTRRYGAGVAELRLRPGIARIIAEAAAEGCRLAIATTTTAANVEALCRACFGRGMGQVFDVVAAGDMVAAKKPAPDVYLLALERLGVAPEEALAFEDSRNGLVSARAAGIPVVLVQAMFTEGEPTDGAALVLPGYDAVAGLSGLRAALAGSGVDGTSGKPRPVPAEGGEGVGGAADGTDAGRAEAGGKDAGGADAGRLTADRPGADGAGVGTAGPDGAGADGRTPAAGVLAVREPAPSGLPPRRSPHRTDCPTPATEAPCG